MDSMPEIVPLQNYLVISDPEIRALPVIERMGFHRALTATVRRPAWFMDPQTGERKREIAFQPGDQVLIADNVDVFYVDADHSLVDFRGVIAVLTPDK